MDYFTYKNACLHCEDVSLETLANENGTPLYVYSYASLKSRFNRFKKAFGDLGLLVCYSMKANSSRAVLRTFIKEGGGIDVVSGGELERALQAGCDPKKIVYSGVGKTSGEIRAGLTAGILQFNVESEMELLALNETAGSLGKRAPIAFRVNPDVDALTHAYISTGLEVNKFGIDHDHAVGLFKKASCMKNVEVTGIACHIGSQLTEVSPFVSAAKKIAGLVEKLSAEGISIRSIDLGGGLGIAYKDETPPTPEEYAKAILGALGQIKGLPLLILEPGRFLTGNAGVLLSRVIYNKSGKSKEFVVVDAAINDLVRPTLYSAYHRIRPVLNIPGRRKLKADIVGPICESGDFLAQERETVEMKPGEFMAIMSAGAYGFSMSSNYNSRPRCAEVMVCGKDYFVIRKRETMDDLMRGEELPHFLE